MSKGEKIYYGPDWVAITPQRAEVRWTGPTSQASKADLARLASDVFATEACAETRWFDWYPSDAADLEEDPPYFIRKSEPTQPTQDNDPGNMRIGDPWMLGARGVFEIVRLLRKEYGDGPADLFMKTFYGWAYKPDPAKPSRNKTTP